MVPNTIAELIGPGDKPSRKRYPWQNSKRKMAQQVQFEQWVPFPLEQVFLFFANPENLPRIMPPQSGTRIEALKLTPPPQIAAECSRSSIAGVGSEIHTSFRPLPFLPFRASWTALITEFEWNHYFADIQKKGPFKSFHHRHQLTAETQDGIAGTIILDVIRFEAGFGWFGWLAELLFVLPQMRRAFRHRQKAVLGLLQSSG
jgi:ligand-binding SRPBCC domain-containing protein